MKTFLRIVSVVLIVMGLANGYHLVADHDISWPDVVMSQAPVALGFLLVVPDEVWKKVIELAKAARGAKPDA